MRVDYEHPVVRSDRFAPGSGFGLRRVLGRRTTSGGNASGGSGISETTGPSWVDPAFDAAGNMTEAPKPGDETTKHKYIYDAWNRLVIVKDNADATLWTYEYDGRGRRIVETEVASDPDVVWDDYYTEDWKLIEVRKDGDVDPYQQFVWGVNYIDSLIVEFLDSNTDGTIDDTLYAAQDANFSVMALTDASGDVQERYIYTPYGQPTVLDPDFSADADGKSDFNNPILFAGYVHDAESALFHVRNRHYHPALGRWAQRDPALYADSSSLYLYALSDPLSKRDPSGLVTYSLCKCNKRTVPGKDGAAVGEFFIIDNTVDCDSGGVKFPDDPFFQCTIDLQIPEDFPDEDLLRSRSAEAHEMGHCAIWNSHFVWAQSAYRSYADLQCRPSSEMTPCIIAWGYLKDAIKLSAEASNLDWDCADYPGTPEWIQTRSARCSEAAAKRVEASVKFNEWVNADRICRGVPDPGAGQEARQDGPQGSDGVPPMSSPSPSIPSNGPTGSPPEQSSRTR